MTATNRVERMTHAFIGRLSCGCVSLVFLDDPDDPPYTNEHIVEAARSGYRVERITADEARALTLFCQCRKEAP